MKSNKQRRAELRAKKQARRVATARAMRLEALGGGVPVDRGALVPDGSYSIPEFVERGYYVDIPFECRECGEPQTWTAAQQKWWYEVAKGGVWTTAKLCRPCRRRARGRREESRRGDRGDPNPYKGPGLLIAKVCSTIEPGLLAAGFAPAGRNRRDARRLLFIDYARPDALFSIAWDQHQARLAAASVEGDGDVVREIAATVLDGVRSSSEIDARLVPFLAAVQAYLEDLQGSPHRQIP